MSNILSRRVVALGLVWCLLLGCQSGPAATRAPVRPAALPVTASEGQPAAQSDARTEMRDPAGLPVRPYSLEAVSNLEEFQVGLREGHKRDLAALIAPTIYTIEAQLHEEERALTVHQEVRYTNQAEGPLSEIYFRLLPNQPGHGGSLVLVSLMVPGWRAGWALTMDNTTLRIELEPPLQPGVPLRIVMDYRVTVPENNPVGFGVFTYQNGEFSLDHFYAWIPVYDQEGWHLDMWDELGDPTYSDVALYDVALITPAEMRVVGSGRMVSMSLNGDGTKTTRFLAGPMRDYQLVAGHDLKSVEGEVDGIRVISYFREDHDEEAREILGYAIDAMRIFQQRFGPYPYTELSIVEAPIRAVGMEYPGLVLIGSRVYRRPEGSHDLSLEYSVVHEIAHQWWYGLIGSDQQREPWLDESLANYAPILYFEDIYGPERARQEMEGSLWSSYWLAMALNQDAAIRQPVLAFSKQNYYAIVYAKGALFLDALRRKVGDDTFDRILKTYYREFKYRNAHTDDLLGIAEREAGRSLADLYAAWQINPTPVALFRQAPLVKGLPLSLDQRGWPAYLP